MSDASRREPLLDRELEATLQEPRFLAFLPMIYVAWADGELTPGEIEAICAHSESLDGDCRGPISRWLDPAHPPSPRALRRLLATIRETGGELSGGERLSLVELGLELVRTRGATLQPGELAALKEIDSALGIPGSEVTRRLLAPERPDAAPGEPEAAFDVGAMARLLEGGQHGLRRRLKELLSEGEFAYEYGTATAAYRAKTLARCRILAREGYGALSFPPEHGGRGDVRAFIAAFETLALGDLSLVVKFGVQFGLFGGSIFQLGTEKHHRRFLGPAARMELAGCFAMTETGHGSNVQDLETVARYDPETDELVVDTPGRSGYKDYIGNAACHARMATVFAQLQVGDESHGVHAVLVPIRDEAGDPLPGVTIEDCGEKLGLNGVDNGRLAFDGVRVPRENLLDRFASLDAQGHYESPIPGAGKRFFTMLGTLVGGRVSVALAGLSASKSALAIAVRYAVRRRQFGPTGEPETLLLDYLAHQRRLLPRLATTYALSFALRHLVDRYADAQEEERREVEGLAAGLKAYATWHATDTIQTCREACGGQGYLAVNRFAALKADTDVFTTFEGDNTVLYQLVVKGLLGEYRREVGNLDLLGVVRYLAERAAVAVAELNPIVTRRTDEEHLRDRDFHLAAFRWREEHLLSTLARRLKKRIDDGMDALDALNACQDHALATAHAHVERVVLERFAEAAEGCEREDVAGQLGVLCDLFALARMEADRGWFLEHGYLEGGKARAVRDLVSSLCGEVRGQALHLVEGFAIPDALLGAPIAV